MKFLAHLLVDKTGTNRITTIKSRSWLKKYYSSQIVKSSGTPFRIYIQRRKLPKFLEGTEIPKIMEEHRNIMEIAAEKIKEAINELKHNKTPGS